MPPAVSSLPPAAPTTVTAAHMAMRMDHRDIQRHRVRDSSRNARGDRCKTGDTNDGTGQHTFQDLTAAFHCVIK
jgi:hypothetical protein